MIRAGGEITMIRGDEKSRWIKALVLGWGLILLPVHFHALAQPAMGGSPSPCPEEGQEAQDLEVWARVDGEPILKVDVETPIEAQLNDLYQKVHDLQRRSLDQLINVKILEREARKRNVTVERLIETEVRPRVKPVTQQEVDRESLAIQERQPGSKPDKEAVRRGIYSQRYYAVLGQFVERLKREVPVEILLPPPKAFVHQVVAEESPWTGGRDAPVTVVEFSDFQCPSCKGHHQTVKDLLQEFKGRVKLVARQYPLGYHPLAQKAAEAALCAHEQGAYWEYADLLFSEQESMQEGTFRSLAEALGLDMGRFGQCLDSGRYRDQVLRDKSDGAKAGVSGTPTFFVNGKRVPDLRRETIRSAILKELGSGTQDPGIVGR